MSNINNPNAKLFTNQNPGYSRAIGGVYHNLTGKPMLVTITVYSSAVGMNSLSVQSDALPAPLLLVGSYSHDATVAVGSSAISFMVIPGNYYTAIIVQGAPTIASWTEWV